MRGLGLPAERAGFRVREPVREASRPPGGSVALADEERASRTALVWLGRETEDPVHKGPLSADVIGRHGAHLALG